MPTIHFCVTMKVENLLKYIAQRRLSEMPEVLGSTNQMKSLQYLTMHLAIELLDLRVGRC